MPRPKKRSQASGLHYQRRRNDGVKRTRRAMFLDDTLYEQIRTLTKAPTDVYGTIGEGIEYGMKMLIAWHRQQGHIK